MIQETPHCMYRLVAILSRIDNSTRTQATLFESQVDISLGRIKQIENARTDKTQELALSNASGKKWKTISAITQDCFSAVTFAAGAYSIKENGATPGSLMAVAAGATAIANRLFQATGLYETDTAKAVATGASLALNPLLHAVGLPEAQPSSILETGVQTFSSLLSLAGGAASWAGGIADGGIETVTSVASGLFNGALNTCQKSYESDSLNHGAFIKESTSEITLLYQDIFQIGQSAERIELTMGKLSEITKHCAETLNIKDS